MDWVVRPNDAFNCKLYVSVANTSDLLGLPLRRRAGLRQIRTRRRNEPVVSQ
jgi:hypothetical protein